VINTVKSQEISIKERYMSTAENKTIVRRLFDEGFNKGNFEPANEMIASEYIDHSPIPAPMPGPEGFAKRMAVLKAAFVQEAVFGVFLAEDDLVSFTWTFNGVHNGPFAGIQPTGKKVSLSGINVERLKDGKVVEHWSHFDLAGLMKQINS
jgi:predicted ester cyclase